MLFDNTQRAYHLKTDRELYKAYYLFRLISNSTLVTVGSWFAQLSLKLRLPVAPLFKATVFSQFCAGLNKEESLELVNKLAFNNIINLKSICDKNIKLEKILKSSFAARYEDPPQHLH